MPLNCDTVWKKYRDEIHLLNELRIPRYILQVNDPSHIQIHVFCDASEAAYGACIYIRCTNIIGEVTCSLLASKSRVAPVKRVTIPRLELCVALLGAQLLDSVKKSWKRVITANHAILWTDSSIVWRWVCTNSKTRRWKTFVANRVSEVQELTGDATWRHVRTKDNPANCLSRGMSVTELLKCKLWWNGPKWLTNHPDLWPRSEIEEVPEEILEQRTEILMVRNEEPDELLVPFSKLEKLQRVTAYCYRAIDNFKKMCKGVRNDEPLNADELEAALMHLICGSQN